MLNKNICRPFLASLTCLTLIACGGGSSDEAATVVTAPTSEQLMASYSGMTESAALTEDEIYPLLNYLIEGDTAGFEQHKAQMQEDAHDVLSSLNQPKAMASYSENCAYTGQLTISGNYNSTTFPINVTYNYQNCKNSSYEGTLSGKITYIYRAADENYEPTDFSIIYTNYRQQLSTNEFTELHGSSDYIETSSCRSSFVSNLLVTTPEINVLEKDLTTNVNDCLSDNKLDISGRLYLSYLGYLDISSDGQVIIDEQGQISSGLLTMSNEQSTINIATTDSTSAVTVDSDNDGSYEYSTNAPTKFYTEKEYWNAPDDDKDGYPNSEDAYPNDPKHYETLSISTNFIDMESVWGGNKSKQSFIISGPNLSWSINNSAEWLVFNKLEGDGEEEIEITTTRLSIGRHQARVTITNELDGSIMFLNVTVDIIEPTLSLSSERMKFDFSNNSEPITQTVALSLDTDSNNYEINCKVLGLNNEHVVIEIEDGGVSQENTNVKVLLTPEILNLQARSGVLDCTINVLEELLIGKVKIQVLPSPPEHMLSVPQKAIAFAKFPNVGVLTKEVVVLDNQGLDSTQWQATSSANWLSVSASGTTSDKLIITADPMDLEADTFYQATIEVTSSDSTVNNIQTINVGLWVGSSDPLTKVDLDIGFGSIKADPLRPYVYVHNYGTNIKVYNVYTQELVSTIDNVGIQLSDMEVSSDGERLYVIDNEDDFIHLIDLDNTDNRESWFAHSYSMFYPYYGGRDFTLSVTNNNELLINSFGDIYEAKTGWLYDSNLINSHLVDRMHGLDASLYGNRLCTTELDGELYCYSLDFDYENDQAVISEIDSDFSWRNVANGKDIAVNHDGSVMYTTGEASDSIIAIDIDTMTLTSELFVGSIPSAVEIASDNAIHAACYVCYGSRYNVWVYGENYSLRNSAHVSVLGNKVKDRGIAVSGDGFITIAINGHPASNDNSSLSFVSSY